MREGECGHRLRLLRTEIAPGQVVERPACVRDAPMGHEAVRVRRKRLPEALHTLFLIEAVAPVEAKVEPLLCVGRASGDASCVGAEVETIHSQISVVAGGPHLAWRRSGRG